MTSARQSSGQPTDEVAATEAEIAGTISELSEQTRRLVRSEVAAARSEMLDKAKQSAPVLGLVAGAAVLGVFAGASCYRFSLRLLERVLPPAPAALLAVLAYGGGAAALAAAAYRRAGEVELPLPFRTARRAVEQAERVA